MSKFLTPPVWYDKNGNLNEMLTGNAVTSSDIAIGSGTKATGGGVAINGGAVGGGVAINGSATGGGVAIDGGATDGGVAINGTATGGGVAINGTATGGGIGIGGDATGGKIQIGNSGLTYELTVGNGRMSLNVGSTAESNWIRATSGGISQGLYLVRYNNYISLVYLMAPIAITDPGGSTHTDDWYFPFATSPIANPNGILYYLKVAGTTSSASALSITPVFYNKSTSDFVTMADGDIVMLFKIL